MIWLAISERGISTPFFLVKKSSLTGEIYREAHVTTYLVSFISEYHQDREYVFWPDLATANYTHATIVLMEDLCISFVPRDKNPS